MWALWCFPLSVLTAPSLLWAALDYILPFATYQMQLFSMSGCGVYSASLQVTLWFIYVDMSDI